MRLFDLIRLLEPDLDPTSAKVHLACWNGNEHPIDVYLSGTFNEWQRWQTRRNFERQYVISLIKMSERNRWLFAGVFSKNGNVERSGSGYYYELVEVASCSELNGRLVAEFCRRGQQSYPNAENLVDHIKVSHLLPEPMTVALFPGFKSVNLSHAELSLVVEQNHESWRTALSSVTGVYLISDILSGKLYVGSATGGGGIWQRWCQYAIGHGGNVELEALFEEHGVDRARSFRFSVLEIADTHASVNEILDRESHWKRILLSRAHGLNAN